MNMKINTTYVVALVTLGLLIFASPVSATIQQIPVGGTVYIGEQGLDISGPTAAPKADIGWWASGAAIATTSPDYLVSIPDTSNFYVSPTEFGSHTGMWYKLPAKTSVFYVADPQLAIRVEDTTVSVDVTNKWVPTDDEIRFWIDSNLVPISQRAGVGSTPITIKVQAPDGGIYSSLINKAGTATLLDIPVTTTPYNTGSIWDTGKRAIYSPGTYTIWAECNVNSMKDNYNQAGKTVSQKVTLLNQDQNPLIGNKGYVTNPTTPLTTTPPVKVISTLKATTLSPSPVITNPAPTTLITTPSPEITTAPPSPLATELPAPVHTKSPGFDTCLGIASLIIALTLISMKK
jgi:hypothetical protein